MQKEGETRKSPVEIEGSNYTIDMDYVVMALGSKTEINVVKKPRIRADTRKNMLK